VTIFNFHYVILRLPGKGAGLDMSLSWHLWSIHLQKAILKALKVQSKAEVWPVKMMITANGKPFNTRCVGQLDSTARILPNLKCML